MSIGTSRRDEIHIMNNSGDNTPTASNTAMTVGIKDQKLGQQHTDEKKQTSEFFTLEV